jgi:hypothetical protein
VTAVDPRIPAEYRSLWVPALTVAGLVHHTTAANLAAIERDGFIQPRDPSPKHWAGLVAVFMADATDALYRPALADVLRHVGAKAETLVRLHIRSANVLYRSIDTNRTFQVISLDPIPFREVVEVEGV